MSAQSLIVCTVSPDGDSSRYGQVVRTIEKEHEPIYSHHDAINSYQSHTVHQSIHLIWTDCKTLIKHISICTYWPKAKHDHSGTTIRKRYASDKDLMQADDHGALPLDAQCSGRCVGVDLSNVGARRWRGSRSQLAVPPPNPVDQHHSNAAAPPQSPHVWGGNAVHRCASTTHAAKASWRGREGGG